MSDLKEKHCRPCEGDISALTMDEIKILAPQLDKRWRVDTPAGRLARTFRFRNYYQTAAFVNAVAWVAHRESHHPEIRFGYNEAEVCWWTHAIDGLTENDFICAAKIDTLVNADETDQ